MMCGPHPHFRHWMKHMAAVPKGFLRYQVLRLLNEKPMSGSELMSEIEKKTDGCWQPSPGSIYPLLAWLQERGYSKEVPEPEPGLKRYALTGKGKEFLEEYFKSGKAIGRRIGFYGPSFMGSCWFDHYPEKTRQIVEAGKKVVTSSLTLLDNLREKYAEEAATKATEVLEQTARKIEEINKKLKG